MGRDFLRTGQHSAFSPAIPGLYVALLCDVAREYGLGEKEILEGLGVTRDSLSQVDSRVSLLTGYTAARRAIMRAQDQGLGLAYARAFKVTLMGSVGLLALSSPSVLAALDSMTRFVALRTPFLRATHEQFGDTYTVKVHTVNPVRREVERFSMEVMLVGLANVVEQLCGKPLPGLKIRMACETPPYFREFAADIPAEVIFGTGVWELEGNVEALSQPPLLSNPTMEASAREQCEQEYMQLFGERTGVSERIRDHLMRCESGHRLPTLEQFAEWLDISPRTLKRRLRDEGESYRGLVERELFNRARRLLCSELSITEIGQQLGYNESASFSRAFSRWAGVSPRAYRKQITHGSD